MRLFIIFDLPTVTKNDQKKYNKFRQLLLIIVFWFNKLLTKNITLIIVSNSPEYLISLKPSLNSINLINNSSITSIENLSLIIKDAIILFSFWESNQRDLISYKNSLFCLIDDEDVKNEKKYIYENILEYIIKSLFANEVNLTINKLKNVSNKKYAIQHITSIRNLIFIYTILLSGFNINSIWNSEGINNFEKINSYFN